MEPAEHHGAAGPAGQRRMRRSCPRAGLPRQFLLRTGLRLCRLALPWHAGSLPGRLRAVSLCRLPRRLHVAHAARKRSAGFLPARPRLCVDHRTTMTMAAVMAERRYDMGRPLLMTGRLLMMVAVLAVAACAPHVEWVKTSATDRKSFV